MSLIIFTTANATHTHDGFIKKKNTEKTTAAYFKVDFIVVPPWRMFSFYLISFFGATFASCSAVVAIFIIIGQEYISLLDESVEKLNDISSPLPLRF